jgi:hypothetical protein
MTEIVVDPIALAEERARRLAMIVEGYEVGEEGMPDGSVPGAARPVDSEEGISNRRSGVLLSHPRYVLVTQYGDRGNYRLRLGADLLNVEQLAADAITDENGAELVVCYFDLDELAGPEPDVYEDDVVRYEGNQHRVERVDEELIEGEVGRYLCLLDAGHESGSWDDYDHRIHQDDVEVIERAEPDERLPVRYELAKVVVSVVFNTVPSP